VLLTVRVPVFRNSPGRNSRLTRCTRSRHTIPGLTGVLAELGHERGVLRVEGGGFVLGQVGISSSSTVSSHVSG
jgi:hypothetical protein